MRRNILMVALVGSVSGMWIWQAAAVRGESQPGRLTGYEARVALIDIVELFKKYEKFNRLSEQMKADVKRRDSELAQLRAELKSLLNQRGQYKPNTQTFKQMEEKLARTKAELDLKVERARREFQQREADLYYQTYREVEAAVRQYAEARGITMVLRTARSENVSPNNPQDVIKQVSRQVVYSLPGMDITNAVAEMLNRASGVGQRQLRRPASRPSLRTGDRQPRGNPKRR